MNIDKRYEVLAAAKNCGNVMFMSSVFMSMR